MKVSFHFSLWMNITMIPTAGREQWDIEWSFVFPSSRACCSDFSDLLRLAHQWYPWICDGRFSEKKDLRTRTWPKPTMKMAIVTKMDQIMIRSFRSSARFRPCKSKHFLSVKVQDVMSEIGKGKGGTEGKSITRRKCINHCMD